MVRESVTALHVLRNVRITVMSDVHDCPDCGAPCSYCLNSKLLAAMAETLYGIEHLPNESDDEYRARIADELSTDGPNV